MSDRMSDRMPDRMPDRMLKINFIFNHINIKLFNFSLTSKTDSSIYSHNLSRVFEF